MAQRFTKDPFYVLDVPRTATKPELEAVAASLLDALAQGVRGAARYLTPLGERRRDAGSVNEATHALREADTRIVHEVWAGLPVRSRAIEPAPAPAPWPGGERALGWRHR